MGYSELEHQKIKSASKIVLEQSPYLSEKISQAITTIAKIVGSTLGPNGKTVLIERSEHGLTPFQSKDGVTVARALSFNDPVKHAILETFRDAAIKTVEFAGDGTTTATVLAYSIYKNIFTFLSKNKKHSSQACFKEVERFFNNVCLPYIDSKTVKVNLENKNDLLLKVATISSNGDVDLSKAILDAFDEIGDEGHITIGEATGPKSYEVEKIRGFPIAKGYEEALGRFCNEFLNDPAQNRIYLENPAIILYDGKLLDIAILAHYLKLFDQEYIQQRIPNMNFVVFAHEFSGDVIGHLAKFFKQTPVKVVCCTTPTDIVANARTEFLHDLAAFTGGKIFNPFNATLADAMPSDLGNRMKAFEMQRFRSCLLGDGNQASVIKRVEDLRIRLKTAASKIDEHDLNVRIGKISGGIAKLTIRDVADSQIRETKDRAEDAICAIRGAIKKGVLPGGCRILLDLAVLALSDSSYVVREILGTSLVEPMSWLLNNCGLNDEESQQILENLLKHPEQVYNALNGQFGDAMDIGLLDSQPAVTEALRSAIAIAKLLGDCGGVIVFGRDENLERAKALSYHRETDRLKQAEEEINKTKEDLQYDITTIQT